MKFVDPVFLLALLPLAVAAFYAAARLGGTTWALGMIVLASLVFYAPYGSPALPLLALSLVVNLAIGVAVSRPRQPRRGALLAAGFAFNFGVLGLFKYLDQVEHMAAPSAAPLLAAAIPAGISFYTFHQAVFVRDAARRQVDVLAFVGDGRGLKHGLALATRYAAFVAFFPQLVIGPITFMSEFGPQIRRASFGRFNPVNIQVGATLIVVGLVKKLCFADLLGEHNDPVFAAAAAGDPVSQAHALIAVFGYFFQLYFDFSGYSDIALGIARLFGIRLPINFDSPLRAAGIVDFYRRWHVTLTRVIVLFVFTPLALAGARFAMRRGLKGWRGRALAAWLPFLINFQLIALWHAAKPTFIVFGLVHGVWYVLETELRTSRAFRAFRTRTSDTLRTVGGMALSAAPLILTFALFRSDSLTAFGRLMRNLVGVGSAIDPSLPDWNEWAPIVAAAVVVYLAPNVYETLRNYRPGIRVWVNPSRALPALSPAWRPTLPWALFVLALATLAFLRLNHRGAFLYQGF